MTQKVHIVVDFNDENDCVVIDESELENIINDLFALNKDKFVKSIFNYGYEKYYKNQIHRF